MMGETHTADRTRHPPRARIGAGSAPPAANVTKRTALMRADLEASRRDNDRLRRSYARLQAENMRLATQQNQRPATTDHRVAMRDAMLDRCSLDP